MNFGPTFMSKPWLRKRSGSGEWGRPVGPGRVAVSTRLVSFSGSGSSPGADSAPAPWLLVRSQVEGEAVGGTVGGQQGCAPGRRLLWVCAACLGAGWGCPGWAILSLDSPHPQLLCPPEVLWPRDLHDPSLWGSSSETWRELTTMGRPPWARPWVLCAGCCLVLVALSEAFLPVFFSSRSSQPVWVSRHRLHDSLSRVHWAGELGPDF